VTKKSIAPDENVVFKDICKMLKKWGRKALILRVIHVSLIIIATVSSVYVATTVYSATTVDSNSFLATTESTAIAALIAAVSAALFAGLDLGSKSNNVRTAWRKLNTAVMKYRVGDIGIQALIECYEKGEELIGDIKVSLQGQ
jgi:energy-converting hydrogenase Eha subunit A